MTVSPQLPSLKAPFPERSIPRGWPRIVGGGTSYRAPTCTSCLLPWAPSNPAFQRHCVGSLKRHPLELSPAPCVDFHGLWVVCPNPMFPVSPVTFSMKFAKYSVGFFFFRFFFRAEMSIYFISGVLAYLCKKTFLKNQPITMHSDHLWYASISDLTFKPWTYEPLNTVCNRSVANKRVR